MHFIENNIDSHVSNNIINIIDELIDDDVLNTNYLIKIIEMYGEKNVYNFFEIFIKY
jgi:hypothetical protein